MSTRPIARYELLPDGLTYVVDSDPKGLRMLNGKPNVSAVARAADLSVGAWHRVVTRKRPWAGQGTAERVSGVAAAARNIPLEEAMKNIFKRIDENEAVAA